MSITKGKKKFLKKYKKKNTAYLVSLGIVLGEQALDLLSIVGMDSHQVLYLFRGRPDPAQ